MIKLILDTDCCRKRSISQDDEAVQAGIDIGQKI